MRVLPSAQTGPGAMSVAGFGPIAASALTASVQEASSFARPRELAASLGQTHRRNASGGKRRLGRISRMGNRRLRELLIAD